VVKVVLTFFGDSIMKVHIFLLTLGMGLVLGLHLAMNAKVGSIMNSPRVGNAIFWIIGAIMATLIGVTGLMGAEGNTLSMLKQVNPLLLTAGAMGACIVFFIAWIIPQIGAGPSFAILLSGQIIFGLIASHFGWLGSPVQSITLFKLVGVAMMIGGICVSFLK